MPHACFSWGLSAAKEGKDCSGKVEMLRLLQNVQSYESHGFGFACTLLDFAQERANLFCLVSFVCSCRPCRVPAFFATCPTDPSRRFNRWNGADENDRATCGSRGSATRPRPTCSTLTHLIIELSYSFPCRVP